MYYELYVRKIVVPAWFKSDWRNGDAPRALTMIHGIVYRFSRVRNGKRVYFHYSGVSVGTEKEPKCWKSYINLNYRWIKRSIFFFRRYE